jgi:hypothetical protein
MTHVSRKPLRLNPDVRQSLFSEKYLNFQRLQHFFSLTIITKFQRPILSANVFDCLSCLAQKQLSEQRRWTHQFLFIKGQDCDRSSVSTGGPWALHLDLRGLERVQNLFHLMGSICFKF